MTLFFHLFIKSVNQKVTSSDIKYHLTLNIIFSVVVCSTPNEVQTYVPNVLITYIVTN